MGIWKKPLKSYHDRYIQITLFCDESLSYPILIIKDEYYGSNILKLYIVLHYETMINRNGIQMVHVGFLQSNIVKCTK